MLVTVFGCGGDRRKPITKTTQSPDEIPTTSNPIYNVYIENSASIDGYVNGVTEFKTAVYNYLSDIKIADLTDSINLNYINSKEIPHGSNITDFIEKLDPATFRSRGGNRGTTDIADVLEMALNGTSENNVSILISDFIFSTGKGKDTEQYLVNQQIGIKNSMAEHLKKFPNHAVIIYGLESKFNGTYYNKYDTPSNYTGNRPYYIWIIGDRQHLSNLTKKCPAEKFKGGGVKSSFSIVKEDAVPVKYAIQYGSGNFKLDKKDPHKSIVGAQKDTKGVGEKKLRFNVNVDFSELLMNDAYLLDAANYDISDKDYQLEIQRNSTNGYSHTLKLSTLIVKPTSISIKLKSQVPLWVDDISDDIGENINDPNQACKTYGFKYLVYGIYEAFTKDGEYCADIDVKINQKN